MKTIIPFLKKLKKNNNKVWFDSHKDEYETARQEFIAFTTDVLKRLEKKDRELQDLDPAKCVFRIYRDVRFSKDKTPYKKHFAADFGPGGRKAQNPGYYMHIEPGNCFLVAGTYMPEPDKLQKIRMEIDYQLPEFKRIISAKDFKKYYGSLSEEDKGTLAPKGFAKDNPAIEILKLKSFIVVHEFDEAEILKKNFPEKCAQILAVALPFNKFLRRALD